MNQLKKSPCYLKIKDTQQNQKDYNNCKFLTSKSSEKCF